MFKERNTQKTKPEFLEIKYVKNEKNVSLYTLTLNTHKESRERKKKKKNRKKRDPKETTKGDTLPSKKMEQITYSDNIENNFVALAVWG